MSDEDGTLERVRAQLLYQLEALNKLLADAAAAGVDLATVPLLEASMAGLADLVRAGGNNALADGLHTAHARFMKANQRRDQTTAAWGEDIDSPHKESQAKAADDAAEEAQEYLERVLADVSAFLEQLEKGGQ